MYIFCFIVFTAANIGLALQNNYTALLILRMLQSAGSSGTVALANGVVGDTITSAERGSYVAFASLGGVLGPMISPILGGIIGQYAGWHWIFWFLLIFSSAVFIPLILFMPETCRNVVDNGSIPPPLFSRNITDTIRHRHRVQQGLTFDEAKQEEMAKKYRFRLPNPLSTLRVLLDLESAILLVATGLGIGCFYAIRYVIVSIDSAQYLLLDQHRRLRSLRFELRLQPDQNWADVHPYWMREHYLRSNSWQGHRLELPALGKEARHTNSQESSARSHRLSHRTSSTRGRVPFILRRCSRRYRLRLDSHQEDQRCCSDRFAVPYWLFAHSYVSDS